MIQAAGFTSVQELNDDALLTLKERELIVLHYYKDHTLKHVAEIMGMS